MLRFYLTSNARLGNVKGTVGSSQSSLSLPEHLPCPLVPKREMALTSQLPGHVLLAYICVWLKLLPLKVARGRVHQALCPICTADSTLCIGSDTHYWPPTQLARTHTHDQQRFGENEPGEPSSPRGAYETCLASTEVTSALSPFFT